MQRTKYVLWRCLLLAEFMGQLSIWPRKAPRVDWNSPLQYFKDVACDIGCVRIFVESGEQLPSISLLYMVHR